MSTLFPPSRRVLMASLCVFSIVNPVNAQESASTKDAGKKEKSLQALEAIEVVGDADNATPGSTLNLNAPQAVGSRLGLSPKETPASISTMTSKDIEERGITRVQDAAVYMPGVTESPSPGNGGTSLSARGFSGHNSVAQMVDGTRLVVAAGTITYPFSSWPIEQVEVLRGPASVLYGDGSIGAAVNYVTKKPIWDDTEGEAFFTVGSYGRILGGVGSRGPVNDKVAYSVYVDAEEYDGYRDLTDVSRNNYSAAISLKPSDVFKATFSVDGGVNDAPRYFGTPLYNGKLDKHLLKENFNVKDSVVSYDDIIWRAKLEAALSDSVTLRNETYYMTTDRHWRNTESYAYISENQVSRTSFLEILHDQEQVGNRLDLAFVGKLGSLDNRFVVGVDWYDTQLTHTNNSPYTSPASIVNPLDFEHGLFVSSVATTPRRNADLEALAVFLENALDLTSDLKLVVGLRYEDLALENQDLVSKAETNVGYHPTTGRVGLVWQAVDNISFYGQVATGTDPLSGSLSLPNNGTEFDLTTGQQAELGVKGDLPAIRGQWTAAIFHIEKKDLLSRDPENPTITQQIGSIVSEGIELAFAAELITNVTLDTNMSALKAEYNEFLEPGGDRAGLVVSGIPERTANAWLSWQFIPQWKVSAGSRYVGTRPSNTANTTWLPSYTVSTAVLGYDYSKDLNFSLTVNNLTDRIYAVSGSGRTRWLLGEPRTVALTTRLQF